MYFVVLQARLLDMDRGLLCSLPAPSPLALRPTTTVTRWCVCRRLAWQRSLSSWIVHHQPTASKKPTFGFDLVSKLAMMHTEESCLHLAHRLDQTMTSRARVALKSVQHPIPGWQEQVQIHTMTCRVRTWQQHEANAVMSTWRP